jgi:hypothetical protein
MRNLTEKYFPIIEDFLKSNQSARVFCEQKEINQHTLGYWKKKYLDRDKSAGQVKGFASLSVVGTDERNAVTVQYSDGTRLIFDNLPAPEALKQFLPAFEK